MKSDQNTLSLPVDRFFESPAQIPSTEKIIEFYEAAGTDYLHWSRGFNMHMGFYRWGLNPFDREKMLEQLNREIALRLQIDNEARNLLIDLGCGAGAVARSIAKTFPNASIKGVTISPSQVQTATRLNILENLQDQIEILKADFTDMPFEGNTADGVWAVESACYARGPDKENLVQEMARVLKNGGRFVIADCFVKQAEKPFNFLIERCYAAVCRNWALPEMPALVNFVGALERRGFVDICINDISWRVAPSLVHAPFAVFSFVIKKMLVGEPLKRQSINNLKASLLALPIGLNRSRFGYYLISGRLHQKS